MATQNIFNLPLKILLSVLVLLFILLLSLSWITTLVVNQKAGKFIGRNVHLENLDINYFKAAIDLDGLVIYEQNEIDTFVYIGHAHLNFDPARLLSKKYVVSRFELINPTINIAMDSAGFNFDDFISNLTPEQDIAVENQPDDEMNETISYMVKEVNLIDGSFSFSDYSLPEQFHYTIKDIKISTSGISDTTTNLPVTIEMNLNDEGHFSSNVQMDLVNPENIQIIGVLDSLSLASFSPYTRHFLAYPIEKGILNYNLELAMSPQELTNENKIAIEGLEFGSKSAGILEPKLPVKLGLYILKDKYGDINIDMPVDGNPADPEFKLAPTILKTFSNFILKAATQPFTSLAKLVNMDPDKIEVLRFENLQDTLSTHHKKVLDQIFIIHQEKPELVFTLTQVENFYSEFSVLAVESARTKMMDEKGFYNSSDDDLKSFLLERTAAPDTLSLTNLSIALIGRDAIQDQLNHIVEKRNEVVSDYLLTEKQIPDRNLIVITNKREFDESVLDKPEFRIEVSVD